MIIHKPVLLKEVLDGLEVKENGSYIDCTAGEGGHSEAILQKNGPSGKLLAVDWDSNQAKKCRERLEKFGERALVVNASYANLKDIIEKENFGQADGILADLGFSSAQLENERGFSFLKEEPLDMRYGNGELTAKEIINNWPEEEIEKILREYGEEKFSKKIAKKICEERQAKGRIEKTGELFKIIEEAVSKNFQHGRIHCATRTFQALRIAVNGELDNLEKVLPQMAEALCSGGRIAIISFHSLEDRIAKEFIKNNKSLKIVTKHPVTATEQEIKENPRSRSAKLRVAQKI